MQLPWTLALLLALQCWIPLIMGNTQLYMDIDNFANVRTVNFKGTMLRVYKVDGVQVTEPRITFRNTCDNLRYSNLLLEFQLTLPIRIDVNNLRSPIGRPKIGHVSLTSIKVQPDEALARKQANVRLVAQLKKSGEGKLIAMCDTFLRCKQLKEDVDSNPEDFRSHVKFVTFGRVGKNLLRFSGVQSANLPSVKCNPGRWVVFQKRVDGSLSFAQNWNSYVNGFGNPKSNYWMGLALLSAMTVTHKSNSWARLQTARCRLRVEVQDFKGNNYWGEYRLFQVLGPEQNYRLRLGQEVPGSQLHRFVSFHAEMKFSTYDRDNDLNHTDSCSQMWGYGGWWYNNCHNGNLNGAYATDKSITNQPSYASIFIHGRYIPMKRTLMKFRCG